MSAPHGRPKERQSPHGAAQRRTLVTPSLGEGVGGKGSPASAAPAPGLDGGSRPRVGRDFRLQWEAAQDCHVLLYPEGMVKLNQSAGEILTRCDGVRTVDAIVADLEQSFNASGLAGDVLGFLDMARKQRWVVLA